MNYHIYIDESGNTGNIEINEDLHWNYGIQTHFALGAIYIAENKYNALKDMISEILHKYDPKLGDEIELKSTAKYKFKEKLLEELVDGLTSYNTGVYFDIANKKYKVIINMVEYCIYPYYLYKSRNDILALRQRKINVSKDLYNRMEEEDIKMFIDLCQNTENEQDIISLFLEFLHKLKELFIKDKSTTALEIQKNIERVIDFIKDKESRKLSLENILPVKDYTNKGTKESFLPNVDAYNNLISQISQLALSDLDSIYIHHDSQAQFSQVLFDWSEALRKKGCNIKKVEFCDSKSEVIIQVCDFFTGNILRLYKEIINNPCLGRNSRELVALLKPFLARCNVVAPNYEQHDFFEQCKIKYVKTPIPFRN